MRRVVPCVLVAAALAGPGAAQTLPTPLSDADAAGLRAFGTAFETTRRFFAAAVPAQTLLRRALHGMAASPQFGSPKQQQAIQAASAQVDAARPDDAPAMLRGFGDAVDRLHAGPDGTPRDVILRVAVAGMLDGLDGRTRFLPPGAGTDNAAQASIGVTLSAGADAPKVTRVYPQAPAAQAGVQRGDDVLSVDGHATKGLALEDAFALLRGPAGSSVTLVVKRGAAAATSLTLIRAPMRIAAVQGRNIEQVACLRVESFVPGVAQSVRRLLTDMQGHAASPLRGVVLDLRDNAGGRLSEAVAVAEEFLPAGTLIATTKGREAGRDERFVAAASDMAAGLPMIVLVNDQTGGSSEIVAAALHAGRGAVLMGGRTAGAGSVATVVPLPPLGTMRLTTQQLVLATGEALKPPGILPEVALLPDPPGGSGPPAPEAPSSDPAIIRLRRGLSQSPQAGEPFDVPDAPERDFEVRQARLALSMLPPRPAASP